MTKRKIWYWLMSISSVIYILWRLFFTIPLEAGIVSLVAGIALFVAEFISMAEAIIHYICMSREKKIELPVIKKEDYPDVDVFIATHSEEVDLLFKTVNGCKHMTYPDKSKVHIYLCDDNNREEIKKLAEDMKVGYFGLTDNKYAKAGNLNNALGQTNSPLIATFDADMIPRSNFLMETVPYFMLPSMTKEDGKWRERREDEIDEDYKIGFIQTPQCFYNPDLFQFNFFAENNIPNEQDYFFKEVNVGRNGSNSCIYAGSNTVISREALEEVGGIRTKTITEDFATGLDIQSQGYTCYAIDKSLAYGLSPDDFPSLIKQRQRWGRGCVQVISSFKFFKSKLPLLSKLSYFSCLLYWWTFIRRIIYILSPILFTVFGVLVVKTDVWGILFIWLPSYLIYNHSLRVLSGKVRDQKWSNIVDTILCPYMIFPILAESLGIKMKKFIVTNKEKTKARSAKLTYAIPHIILLIATCVGIYFSIKEMYLYNNFLGIVVLFWLFMNAYFLIMAIFFLLGRINYREEERFTAEVPISFHVDKRKVTALTKDISESGLSIVCDFPEFINGINTFTLHDEKWSAEVAGSVVHVAKVDDKWKYSIKLEELDFKQKQEYIQIVYDRVPSLSTEIKTSAIRDLLHFFDKKMKDTNESKRKLPRIVLNRMLKTTEGKRIEVGDYNYQFMTLIGFNLDDNYDIKFGKVTLNLKKVKTNEDSEETLYEIKNWQEVSKTDELNEELKRMLREKD